MIDIYKNWRLQEWEIGISFSWGDPITDKRNWMLNIALGWWTFQFYRKWLDEETEPLIEPKEGE